MRHGQGWRCGKTARDHPHEGTVGPLRTQAAFLTRYRIDAFCPLDGQRLLSQSDLDLLPKHSWKFCRTSPRSRIRPPTKGTVQDRSSTEIRPTVA